MVDTCAGLSFFISFCLAFVFLLLIFLFHPNSTLCSSVMCWQNAVHAGEDYDILWLCVSATGKQHIWLFGKMQQWVLDRLRSHVDVNSAWGKPILLSLWLPTGEAMVEDLKERSLLLAGCCCLRLTCYMLVSLCKKRACGHLWLTCWVVESDSPTCLQQQMQYSTCHMHKCSSTSCKQFVLKKSIVFVFFNW